MGIRVRISPQTIHLLSYQWNISMIEILANCEWEYHHPIVIETEDEDDGTSIIQILSLCDVKITLNWPSEIGFGTVRSEVKSLAFSAIPAQ
jgi:hypothetical protein